ncbi:MAG TPA: hypothetical protein VK821_11290 [Dehalococcoidia bacterium]|nr:hypothetical protein [Dehalococcoidia bacterium]
MSVTAVATGRTPSATSTTSASAPVLESTPAAATPAGQALLQQSGGGGSGNNCCTVGLRTSSFSAPGSWDLSWEYDCSALGRMGNLSIDVFGANGAFISDPRSLFEIGAAGRGVQSYGRAGTFSLDVNSTCRWAVTVTTAARPTATPVGSNAGAAPASAGGGASFSGLSTGSASSTAAAASQSRGGGALQALQPSIPTPRPVVPAALGAFAGPGVAAAREAAAAAVNSAGASSAATPVPTATPLRAVTPSH